MNNKSCPFCEVHCDKDKKICTHCNFPLTASDIEQTNFVKDLNKKVRFIEETKITIKRAKVILIVIAIINLAVAYLHYFFDTALMWVILNALGSVVYVGFAYYIKKDVYVSLLVPMVIFIINFTATFILFPMSILGGIVLKVIVLSIFFNGIMQVRKCLKFKNENEYLGQRLLWLNRVFYDKN